MRDATEPERPTGQPHLKKHPFRAPRHTHTGIQWHILVALFRLTCAASLAPSAARNPPPNPPSFLRASQKRRQSWPASRSCRRSALDLQTRCRCSATSSTPCRTARKVSDLTSERCSASSWRGMRGTMWQPNLMLTCSRPAVAAVLSNWHNVLRAIHMASCKFADPLALGYQAREASSDWPQPNCPNPKTRTMRRKRLNPNHRSPRRS